jgi:hypothetical protein
MEIKTGTSLEELTAAFCKAMDQLNGRGKRLNKPEFQMPESWNEARMTIGKCKCGQAFQQCLCPVREND